MVKETVGCDFIRRGSDNVSTPCPGMSPRIPAGLVGLETRVGMALDGCHTYPAPA